MPRRITAEEKVEELEQILDDVKDDLKDCEKELRVTKRNLDDCENAFDIKRKENGKLKDRIEILEDKLKNEIDTVSKLTKLLRDKDDNFNNAMKENQNLKNKIIKSDETISEMEDEMTEIMEMKSSFELKIVEKMYNIRVLEETMNEKDNLIKVLSSRKSSNHEEDKIKELRDIINDKETEAVEREREMKQFKTAAEHFSTELTELNAKLKDSSIKNIADHHKTFKINTKLKNTPFTCFQCKYETNSKSDIKDHKQQHKQQHSIDCPFCESTFTTLQLRSVHIFKNHKNRIVCKFWRNHKCKNPNCKFKHSTYEANSDKNCKNGSQCVYLKDNKCIFVHEDSHARKTN